MSEKQTFILAHQTARARAIEAIRTAPDGRVVVISQPTRNLAQNARLWVLLEALAQQVNWHGQKLTAEEWKDACTAALKRQRVIPGIDGGFVVLGQRTSRMTVGEMAELQTFIEAFGAQQGVNFDQEVPA